MRGKAVTLLGRQVDSGIWIANVQLSHGAQVLCPVLILGYTLSCTTLRVLGITTRSVVQLSLPTHVFILDGALACCFCLTQASYNRNLRFFSIDRICNTCKSNLAVSIAWAIRELCLIIDVRIVCLSDRWSAGSPSQFEQSEP